MVVPVAKQIPSDKSDSHLDCKLDVGFVLRKCFELCMSELSLCIERFCRLYFCFECICGVGSWGCLIFGLPN